MWLILAVFGVEVFRFGISTRRDKWISNLGGDFELAPDPVEEDYDYDDEDRFGFH